MSNSEKYRLYCCGSRGSRSIEGSKFFTFGGYTSCYILKKDDYALVIDCGTGFYAAGSILADCKKIDILFTHMHYDHILGLLDWGSIPSGATVNYYAKFSGWFSEETFDEFFKKPFWPITPKFNIHEAPDDALLCNNELSVTFHPAPHPDNSSLLTIDYPYKGHNERIVVMFDSEDPNFLPFELIYKCNILIYDGMYDDVEYHNHIGWGHSTWQEGCRLAQRAQCKRLIVTHHEPKRTDIELDSFEKSARLMFENTDFAKSGQIWQFPQELEEEHSGLKISVADKIGEFFDNLRKRFFDALIDTKKMRHFLLVVSCVVLAAVSFFMTAVNVITNKVPVLYATAVFTVLCTVNVLILLRGKARYHYIARRLFQVEMYVLVMFFIVTGSPEGFSAVWTLLIPAAGMLVFGRKETTVLSAVLLVSMLFLFRTGIGRSLLMYNYTESFLLRFPMAFIAFYAMAYFLESVRRATLDVLWKTMESQEERIGNQEVELRDQYYDLENAKNRLEMRNKLLSKTFGKVMPDEIVSNLLAHDGQFEFVGKKQVVTALQCDIRGFTVMTNKMDAMSVMKMLNHYLAEMTEIIQKNNGTVMEFIGDGILAVYGAPNANKNHADDAIASAILMQKKIDDINEWNREHGYPEIEIGIGINTGEAVTGVVGGEQRLKYDVVGRTVNICSRIETYCAGNQVLVSKDTLDAAETTLQIRNRMCVSPKGLNEIITVFEITGIFGKYNLIADYRPSDMKELDEKVKTKFTMIHDEHCELESREGYVVAESSDGMILETECELELYSNIKVEYNDGIFGMITSIEDNRYTIRYTYVQKEWKCNEIRTD